MPTIVPVLWPTLVLIRKFLEGTTNDNFLEIKVSSKNIVVIIKIFERLVIYVLFPDTRRPTLASPHFNFQVFICESH